MKTYIGTIVEQRYGYRMQGGYEPSLSLDCENGDSVPLGNSNFNSVFVDNIGKRIKLTIEELETVYATDEEE